MLYAFLFIYLHPYAIFYAETAQCIMLSHKPQIKNEKIFIKEQSVKCLNKRRIFIVKFLRFLRNVINGTNL